MTSKTNDALIVISVVLLATVAGGIGIWRDRAVTRKMHEIAGDAASAVRKPVNIEGSPSLGPADAPVTVVEFSDPYCGFCARSADVRHTLLARYGDRLRWVYKHFPSGSNAPVAAMAAAEQGKFWPYVDRLFATRELSVRALELHARAIGLDLQPFRDAVTRRVGIEAIRRDREQAGKLGVRGTPTFFVNGRKLVGYFPAAHLEKIVLQELDRARRQGQ